MVVLADKLSSSLAGGIGHVLYMHLQKSKLLLKVGKKNPRVIYLWFCLLGCIITERIHSSGCMENYRRTSLWKHLTSEGDRQQQNISKNRERSVTERAKATATLCGFQTALSTEGRGPPRAGTCEHPSPLRELGKAP